MMKDDPAYIRERSKFWLEWNILVFLGLSMASFMVTSFIGACLNNLNVFGLGMLFCWVAPLIFVLERTETWFQRERALRRNR